MEGVGDKLAGWMGKASQWIEGSLKKQKELRDVVDTLSVDEPHLINRWIKKTFPIDYKGGIEKFIQRTPPEQKLEILKQAANDPNGLGDIRIGANNFIEYAPADPTRKG